MNFKIHYKNIEHKHIINSKPFYEAYENINIHNIEIKFGAVNELNPGRWVLFFQLLKNGIDITETITTQGFCSPIRLNFISPKKDILYFPFENYVLFYHISTNQVTKIEHNSRNGKIYEINNHIVILNKNDYIKIDLDTLENKKYLQENISFIYPSKKEDTILYNDFLNYTSSTNTTFKNIDIEVSSLYDTSFNKFIEQSHIDSQQAYLWSIGINIKNNEYFGLPQNKWEFLDYDSDNECIFIGTQLITSKGVLDKNKRMMSFNAENKYLSLYIKPV